MIVIVYPAGDRSQIDIYPVHDELDALSYSLASRRRFSDHEKSEAIEYAIKLAKENNLIYTGIGLPENNGFHYLD